MELIIILILNLLAWISIRKNIKDVKDELIKSKDMLQQIYSWNRKLMEENKKYKSL